MAQFLLRRARPRKYPPGSVLFTDALAREICGTLRLSAALTAAVVEKLNPCEGENNYVTTAGLPGNLCENRDQAVRLVVDALYNLGR